MKKIVFFAIFLAACLDLQAQLNRTTRLFSYVPAPGQFINTAQIGTPQAAEQVVASSDGLVSLGGLGGTIVLGFEHPVNNHPQNPYGIDFTLFGNAFAGSSEPGIIWVMKDSNGNGKPDDTWWLIAGSSHFDPMTRKNVRIRWSPISGGGASWSTGQHQSGLLPHNEFHLQPYYPDASVFENYPSDSVVFNSDILNYYIHKENGQVQLPVLAFGYADNHPVKSGISPDQPDNPYTPGVTEGAGGDPVDIAWAIDSSGHYVNPDRIDFIRISTGAVAVSDLLGEISTEIAGAVAASPTGATGPSELLTIHPHPASVLSGDSLRLNASFFRHGKFVPSEIIWSVSSSVDSLPLPEGKFVASKGGLYRITARQPLNQDVISQTFITVREPDSIALQLPGNVFSQGMVIGLTPVCYDQFGVALENLEWRFRSSDTTVVSILKTERGYSLKTGNSGSVTLEISIPRFPGMSKWLSLSVLDNDQLPRIYVTAKTGQANLLPAHWMDVESFVQSGDKVTPQATRNQNQGIALDQLLLAIFGKAGAKAVLKSNNADGSSVYLHSVEKGGLFTYGWGGRTDPSAYARCWFVRLNGSHHWKDLEAVSVHRGDTLIVYHVDNILKEWALSFLSATSDSILAGETVRLKASGAVCAFSSTAGVTESVLVPLPGRELTLGEDDKPVAFTGADGTVSFELQTSPPVTFHSGTDAVYIGSKLLTQRRTIEYNALSLFPNPASQYARISGWQGNEAQIRLFDLSGRMVGEWEVTGQNSLLRFDDLAPGMYHCLVRADKSVYQQKIVIR